MFEPGFEIKFLARVVCQSKPDARGQLCVCSDTFEYKFDRVAGNHIEVGDFADAARATFEKRGWQMNYGFIRCPDCRRKKASRKRLAKRPL